jgi:hypothetical protein
VRAAALDRLLVTPGALEVLAEELGVIPASSGLSLVEQLAAIRARAIHLAVTRSPMRGLSVEEIIVLTAYASRRFDNSSWKRELLRQPNQQALNSACEAWLMQRSSTIHSGHRLGGPSWPMVGTTSADPRSPNQLMVAVAPIADRQLLGIELERLANEASFAHEHYLACSPATALGYLDLQAHLTQPEHWDSLVLDRRLRTFGLGLLLVEQEGVLLYLPARYQSRPPER